MIIPLLIQYNSDGSLNTEFANKGFSVIENSYHFADCIALKADGKIVTAGINIRNFSVRQYNPNGTPDSSFGKNGAVITTTDVFVNDYYTSIAIQHDGKIIATGRHEIEEPDYKVLFTVIRYNTDGSLDNDFANNGKFFSDLGVGGAVSYAIALQTNHKILAGGGTNGDYVLIRLLPDGSFDKSFNDSGIVYTDVKGSDVIYTLFVQPDGKILASGSSDPKSFNSFASFVRYIGDPVNLITKAKIKRWIKNHILNWQATVSNNDISYYAIERSNSGNAGFTQIGKVKANKIQPNAATATYAYNLASNAAANSTTTNYYRIRAVNTDGSFVYSDVVSDAGLQTGSAFTISPNPARDVIKVSGLPANRKTVVNLVNRNGNVLQTVTAQSSAISINVNALHSGVYNVNTVINGKVQSVQFVKE